MVCDALTADPFAGAGFIGACTSLHVVVLLAVHGRPLAAVSRSDDGEMRYGDGDGEAWGRPMGEAQGEAQGEAWGARGGQGEAKGTADL